MENMQGSNGKRKQDLPTHFAELKKRKTTVENDEILVISSDEDMLVEPMQNFETVKNNSTNQIIEAKKNTSSMKLTIELVPKTCWFDNVRSNISPYFWRKLSKASYEEAHYQCEICANTQGSPHKLECHEIWNYNDELKIQKLDGLIALCPPCHQVKHVGLAQKHGKMNAVKLHLALVNNWSSAEVEDYIKESFSIWQERSKHQWQLDINFIEQQGIPLKKANSNQEQNLSQLAEAIEAMDIANIEVIVSGSSAADIMNAIYHPGNKNKLNPIHIAVIKNNINFLEALLKIPQMHLYINTGDKSRETPIFYAVKNKKFDMTELLLKYQADVLQVSSRKKNLLHHAIDNNDINCIKLLLNYGVIELCHQYDNWDKLPFHSACKINIEDFNNNKININEIIKIYDLFVPHLNKAEITKIDKYNKTLLHYAVSVLPKHHIQHLFNNGASEVIEVSDKFGKTALHEAAKWGNIEALRLILSYSAKTIVTKVDIYGKSALHEAAIFGRKEIMQILLENGAEFDKKSVSGGLSPFEEAMNTFGILETFTIFSPYMNQTEEQKQTYLKKLLSQEKRQPSLNQRTFFSNSILGKRKQVDSEVSKNEGKRDNDVLIPSVTKKANNSYYANKINNFTNLPTKINRKGLSSISQEELKTLLEFPDNLMFGTAVDDGGCFFDGLAQALNFIQGTDQYSEKLLRKICHTFYLENKTEVQQWNANDYGGIDIGDNYSFVQYTKPELDKDFYQRAPIWGRQHIEGVMLCRKLNLSAIMVIELINNPEDNQLIPIYNRVTKDGVNQIEKYAVTYTEAIPLLVLGQLDLHFIPILSKIGNTNLPSCTSLEKDGIYWIHAGNNGNSSGKWMLYCSSHDVDAAWHIIKKGVQMGSLLNAKVSTDNNTAKHVIIVYTKDYADIKDVIRVHDYLSHHLGLTDTIFYKTNDQTHAGIYSGTASEKPWIYSSKMLEQYRRELNKGISPDVGSLVAQNQSLINVNNSAGVFMPQKNTLTQRQPKTQAILLQNPNTMFAAKKQLPPNYICVNTLNGHTKTIKCIAIMPEGNIVTGSCDNKLKVWDITADRCLNTLRGHNHFVWCVAPLPNSKAISGSWDNTLKVWDIITSKCECTLEGHSDAVMCVAALPNGKAISGSRDKTLKIWNISTGKCERTLTGHSDIVTSVIYLPNGKAVSGSADGTLKVWDIATGKCIRTLKGHSHYVNCLALLPNGQVISGSYDKTLKIWDINAGECLNTLRGHSESVNCVAFLSIETMINGSLDNILRVWNINTGQCLNILKGHTDWVRSVALLPNGNVISGSKDNTLKVWVDKSALELKNGKELECNLDYMETKIMKMQA